CLEYSAGGGEEPRAAVLVVIHFGRKGNFCLFKPVCQLLEGQNGVYDAGVVIRLVLFCDAGTYKYRLGVGISLFDVSAVSLHGGEDVGEILKLVWEILLYEKIDRVAA